MKQKSTKKHNRLERLSKLKSLLLLAISFLLVAGATYIPNARASTIDQEIQALKAQNAQNQAAVADLSQTATSYQNAIAQLEAQIGHLRSQINDSIAKQAELQAKIEEGERELQRQRDLLGEDIKAIYTDGNISTIEILATSKDLSEFIDKETYRNAVQQKIQDTLKKITKLQAELKTQKEEVEQLIEQQKEQQASLSANRAEQNRMLALNKQQQAEFNKKTSANQARIDELIAQQRRANEGAKGGYYFIRVPGSVGAHDVTVDDYPYKDAGFSMQLGPCSHSDSYPDYPDQWGYCTRQCVSYTAWAVERSGRTAPKYYGSAKNWIYAAPASWVHRDPQPGDVAITTAGTWGHAMYVEQVDGDRIYVSQYNQQLTGQYSTQWRTFR
ncbi:MAG TPA: CHAP domain-containing protein [Candidatus Saccharimonadales bacterium]